MLHLRHYLLRSFLLLLSDHLLHGNILGSLLVRCWRVDRRIGPRFTGGADDEACKPVHPPSRQLVGASAGLASNATLVEWFSVGSKHLKKKMRCAGHHEVSFLVERVDGLATNRALWSGSRRPRLGARPLWGGLIQCFYRDPPYFSFKTNVTFEQSSR